MCFTSNSFLSFSNFLVYKLYKWQQVYKGTLPNGQLIAIKRAQKESMQGKLQFKSEIELLSRVHHKNLVSLVGFCFEQGEQILVYEYVPNASLKDALLGTYFISILLSSYKIELAYWT